MALRVLIVTLLLGASIGLQVRYGQFPRSGPAFSYLIVATYGLTILYGFLLPRIKRLALFAYVQIGIDLLFETTVVYLTGGIESPFSPFYMITTIAGSIILGRKGGSLTASTASILFGLLVDLQYFRLLPAVGEGTYSNRETLFLLFLNIVAFLTVAYLSGSLAEKLSVTQIRLREEEADLAELKLFHEYIVRSMTSGLLTTGMTGEITSFNRSAEEITGYRFSEVRGKPWWEVLDLGDLRSLIHSNRPLAEPIRFDRESLRKDGIPLLLGMTVSPLRNEEGDQIGSVWIFQNLTRIRQMEEEIENKKRLATIGEMAAGMAHEIRNPLAALSGCMQVLKGGLRLEDAEARRLMEIALKETERLDGIIAAFLSYARPVPLNKKHWDINRLILETMDLLRRSPEYPEGVEIRLDLAEGELGGIVDPDRVRQVFWNLSINAFHAVGREGWLLISTRPVTTAPSMGQPQSAWVEVCFSDNGCGILKRDLHKIFFPFFTTKERGTGLGLSIVHRIVEEHGGRIHVDSEAGRGARFTLLLPAEAGASRAPQDS